RDDAGGAEGGVQGPGTGQQAAIFESFEPGPEGRYKTTIGATRLGSKGPHGFISNSGVKSVRYLMSGWPGLESSEAPECHDRGLRKTPAPATRWITAPSA